MKGFKLSPIHLPAATRIKVKKTHYKVILVVGSTLIVVVHHYYPQYEAHVSYALNILFIVDPSV